MKKANMLFILAGIAIVFWYYYTSKTSLTSTCINCPLKSETSSSACINCPLKQGIA